VPRRNEMLSALHKEMPAVLDYLSQIMSRTMDGQHSAERIIILEALCGGEVFGFGVEGLGFGVWSLRFWVWSSGFRVSSLGFGDQGSGIRV